MLWHVDYSRGESPFPKSQYVVGPQTAAGARSAGILSRGEREKESHVDLGFKETTLELSSLPELFP
jgi:hypothetical protein